MRKIIHQQVTANFPKESVSREREWAQKNMITLRLTFKVTLQRNSENEKKKMCTKNTQVSTAKNAQQWCICVWKSCNNHNNIVRSLWDDLEIKYMKKELKEWVIEREREWASMLNCGFNWKILIFVVFFPSILFDYIYFFLEFESEWMSERVSKINMKLLVPGTSIMPIIRYLTSNHVQKFFLFFFCAFSSFQSI
jgi:hypothetical protein